MFLLSGSISSGKEEFEKSGVRGENILTWDGSVKTPEDLGWEGVP
ncbi:MAG: hypothetical protein MjAS7_1905 [Metallosphaera javensis (ex Sakai et al. 2022)]|nr:MAG: hypothetical protein MjAS7_1905 [Metallosphaera javensis (ex Sakai et al. 2022)]